MAKLTEIETGMLSACMSNDAAWVTSPTSPASVFLAEWETQGWAERCAAPAEFLIAYRITPAGRAALQGRD